MKRDNELIAEFMGMRIEQTKTKSGKDWFQGFCFYPEYRTIKEWSCGGSSKEGVERSLKTFHHQYDTSWDWLMPVVEKIESEQGVYYMRLDRQNACVIIGRNGYPDGLPVAYGHGKNRLEATYNSVVTYIKREWD